MNRKEIKLYNETKIESLLSKDYICINKDMTILKAMNVLIKEAENHCYINNIYVVDEKQIYCGMIYLKDLIIARKEDSLQSLIQTHYPYLYGDKQIDGDIVCLYDDKEETYPILNKQHQLLGVITISKINELYEEINNQLDNRLECEDLRETVKESVIKRIPWLMILFVLGLFVSFVVGLFEEMIKILPIIVCFQSLILDMAGNVGTQSLAVTIRVLSDKNITLKKKYHIIFKEVKVGMINGLLLGLFSVFALGIYIDIIDDFSLLFSFFISSCIALSLFFTMGLSSLIGTLIPLFFDKIHIDPAVASGPFITTINDFVAIIFYYGLSWFVLIQLFHII